MRRIGPYTASDRTQDISDMLEELNSNFDLDTAKICVAHTQERHDLVFKNGFLRSITSREAFWMDTGPLQKG